MNISLKLCAAALIGAFTISLTGCGLPRPADQSPQNPVQAAQTAIVEDFTGGVGVLPLPEQLAAAEITRLDLPISCGYLIIAPGEGYSLSMGDELRKHYECRLDNHTLSINDTSEEKWWNQLKGLPEKDLTLILTFPTDKASFDTVALDMKVGSGELRGFTCQSLSLESGVSDISLSDITAQSMTFSGGVGEIVGRDLIASESLTVESGVGATDLRGDFTGQIELNAGVGEMTLHLARPQSAYTINTQKGIGSMDTGNDSTAIPVQNDALKSTIKLSMGIGDVSLQFMPE